MKAVLSLPGGERSVDFSRPIDISIPLDPNGEQPSCFGAPRATSKAYSGQGFVLDTRRGGSCNCDELRLLPHCNGTHTECAGHITEDRISIATVLPGALCEANLISVAPEPAKDHPESSCSLAYGDDTLITRRILEAALSGRERLPALIVRSLPNLPEKRYRDYSAEMPPYFTERAMELVRELDVIHLLVDLPSVDRLSDGGALSAHHVYWGIPPAGVSSSSRKTITEMIYVPEGVRDGVYLLDLQIAPLVSDASPSRPLLFELL